MHCLVQASPWIFVGMNVAYAEGLVNHNEEFISQVTWLITCEAYFFSHVIKSYVIMMKKICCFTYSDSQN